MAIQGAVDAAVLGAVSSILAATLGIDAALVSVTTASRRLDELHAHLQYIAQTRQNEHINGTGEHLEGHLNGTGEHLEGHLNGTGEHLEGHLNGTRTALWKTWVSSNQNATPTGNTLWAPLVSSIQYVTTAAYSFLPHSRQRIATVHVHKVAVSSHSQTMMMKGIVLSNRSNMLNTTAISDSTRDPNKYVSISLSHHGDKYVRVSLSHYGNRSFISNSSYNQNKTTLSRHRRNLNYAFSSNSSRFDMNKTQSFNNSASRTKVRNLNSSNLNTLQSLHSNISSKTHRFNSSSHLHKTGLLKRSSTASQPIVSFSISSSNVKLSKKAILKSIRTGLNKNTGVNSSSSLPEITGSNLRQNPLGQQPNAAPKGPTKILVKVLSQDAEDAEAMARAGMCVHRCAYTLSGLISCYIYIYIFTYRQMHVRMLRLWHVQRVYTCTYGCSTLYLD